MAPRTARGKRSKTPAAPMFYASAFGLNLACDQPLPGLVPQRVASPPDTYISLSQSPSELNPRREDELWYASGGSGIPALRAWRTQDGSSYTLAYADGTTFTVDCAGTRVRGAWGDDLTLADAAVYVLGPVLGFVLRLREHLCLHASAVDVHGRALALLGPAGAGKSTTAAALALRGYALLTEDVLLVKPDDAGFEVVPGYPQVRLWPDSAALLFGDASALPKLTPTWDKRALDYLEAGLPFQRSPRSLAAIYVLPETRDAAALRVAPLGGAERLLTLLANTYVGYLLDRTQRQQEFVTLAHLADTIPIRRVTAAPDSLAAFCDGIIRDFETL